MVDSSMGANAQQTGSVKWFDREKGFGFIRVDDTGEEIFVHYSQIDMPGFRVLDEGQRVSLTIGQAERGAQAEGVRPLDTEGDLPAA